MPRKRTRETGRHPEIEKAARRIADRIVDMIEREEVLDLVSKISLDDDFIAPAEAERKGSPKNPDLKLAVLTAALVEEVADVLRFDSVRELIAEAIAIDESLGEPVSGPAVGLALLTGTTRTGVIERLKMYRDPTAGRVTDDGKTESRMSDVEPWTEVLRRARRKVAAGPKNKPDREARRAIERRHRTGED